MIRSCCDSEHNIMVPPYIMWNFLAAVKDNDIPNLELELNVL